LRRLTEPARPNLMTGTLADLPCCHAELLAENAELRQQLIVLGRSTKTPRLTWREHLSLILPAIWVPNWKQVLQIIQPDILLRWHRESLWRFWKLKSRKQTQTQPQRLGSDTIALIQRMARENPLWEAERIRGELLNLDINVAKRSIWNTCRRRPPNRTLGNHGRRFCRRMGRTSGPVISCLW
jgi:putative transposase